ncbi:hypothetical protein F443_15089 [Phytophthora nicotianae P1569]|uniref:PiggyBac transposable element-derived protein domain-containing protein n=1 Tax=Phytophthora nicotianae P1569 TaxID=1317065 RepID=V9EML0_PHYNI|nr:hypothetical protein F443_15089 [Phytophthora nicotianae P1569]
MRARALLRRETVSSTAVLTTEDYRRKLERKSSIQPHEVVSFIGLLVAKTLEPRRESLSRHWITKAERALSRGAFGQSMSRDRFHDIARYLHFNDNARLEIYCGKANANEDAVAQRAVVKNVTRVLQGLPSQRLICTDNFYTSFPLSGKLLSMGHYHVGTIRKDRKGGYCYGKCFHHSQDRPASSQQARSHACRVHAATTYCPIEPDDDLADLVTKPLPRSAHTLEKTEEKNGNKRRQWLWKVCSAYAGPGVRNFETSYFCATCSRVKKGRVTLCNKARRLDHGSALTCNEVWHQSWRNGMAIPAEMQHKIRFVETRRREVCSESEED